MRSTQSNLAPAEALYALTTTGELLSQNRVIDALLDRYAATTERAVRDEIGCALGTFARRNLISAAELRTVVGLIEGAAEVEAAFAHLVLAS